MPNSIGPTGLTTATQAELLAQYTDGYEGLYGADIDLSSDSPDGQNINITIQSILDALDLLMNINNMFDPDNAVGVILDQRVAINGIQRQAGTFTVTNITIVTNQSVNLYGLDQEDQPVYTVADNAGNSWILQSTQLAVPVGTNVFSFQAAIAGAIAPIPNTITVPVVIVLGVVSINNPTTYTSLGINEESDANLKVRRQQSVSLASQGYLAGLLAALKNINGVTSAFVYENNTSATDGDGVPGHSIWVIVAGTAPASEIANAIYQKRNAGCGMFGAQSYTVIQVDGTTFTLHWDDVFSQNLFIKFTATSIDGIRQPNIAAIRSGLVTSFVPGVFQEVNINAMATQVQDIDSNTLVTLAGFTTGQSQNLTLSGVAASGAFVLSYNGNASASINWNDSVATIQTQVRSISGLASVVVTGSIASQTLTFNLNTVANVLGLLLVTTNTLQTSAPAAVLFSYHEGYTNTLTPQKKNFQFAVSANNIIIVPMILTPTSSSITIMASLTFTGLGGYGTYTYSIQTNNSGGSINSSTGAYTAGGSGSVIDTILVVDQQGNSATAMVNVT